MKSTAHSKTCHIWLRTSLVLTKNSYFDLLITELPAQYADIKIKKINK